jgi:peptidoglycan/xylan/chitin deacetylase (PgdA/CDA1 family)
MVTIVMYHYIRELARTRYPEIKGLELSLFREQLDYLRRHYRLITAQELIAAVQEERADGSWALPRNSALLTFDDGYAEHFRHVFPLLDEAGVQGCFFPPASTVRERKVLDVNKIHFILAACPDPQAIVGELFRALDDHREENDLESNEAYYERLGRPSRYDPAEVMFVKRMLQTGLPTPLRGLIVDQLFARHVSADEAAFAAELYMSVDELRCMARHGMYVGGHGDRHLWLGRLSPGEQEEEIDRSLEFLADIGTDLDSWIMSYPHGNANDSLLEILRARGCAVGLTTQIDIATSEMEPLLLPRLDTNDLPKHAEAAPNEWTQRVGGILARDAQ